MTVHLTALVYVINVLPAQYLIRMYIYVQTAATAENLEVVPHDGQADQSGEEWSRRNDLKRKIQSLQKKFASLICRSYVAFTCKPVPVDQLQVYLNQRCVDRRASIYLFDQGMLDIINQSSHQQVFMLMGRICAWDFLDYSLLQDAVEEFDVSDLNPLLATYTREVKSFQEETKLIDFLNVWEGICLVRELPSYTTLIARCSEDMRDFTLADVAKRANLLANEFNLLTLGARFGGGRPGSVYLLWYIPQSVAQHMQKVMESANRPDLVRHGIQELLIGKKIYKVSAVCDGLQLCMS